MDLIAASEKSGLPIFLGTYPITPASDILHELSRQKAFGVRTFQAEDEIAAITAAIGASYGGSLGITTTSGPGMALKGEAMGLAMMLEIPLLIYRYSKGRTFNRSSYKNRTKRFDAGLLWKEWRKPHSGDFCIQAQRLF